MQDIGAMLERTKEEKECSVLRALLILLDTKEKEDENVYLLQSKPQQEACR